MNEWGLSEMKMIENEEIDEEDRENNARLLRRQYPCTNNIPLRKYGGLEKNEAL